MSYSNVDGSVCPAAMRVPLTIRTGCSSCPSYHCPPDGYEPKPWEYEQGEKKPQSGGGAGGGPQEGSPGIFDVLKKTAEDLKKKAKGLFDEGT